MEINEKHPENTPSSVNINGLHDLIGNVYEMDYQEEIDSNGGMDIYFYLWQPFGGSYDGWGGYSSNEDVYGNNEIGFRCVRTLAD